MLEKKQTLRLVSYLLLLVIYNLIYFLVGKGSHNAAEWIAYAWTFVALIVSWAAPLLCIKYKRTPENLVTIYLFAWMYSIISIAFNIVVQILNLKSVKFVILINFILFLLYVIQLIFNMRINYDTEKNEETIDSERQFVQGVSAKLKGCINNTNDLPTKRKVEKAYDVVKSSPLHSNTSVIDYEVEIRDLTSELENIIDLKKYDEVEVIVSKIINLTNKRNSMLR